MFRFLVCCSLATFSAPWLCAADGELRILPSRFALAGQQARQRLVVTRFVDGRWVDVTVEAELRVEPAGLVAISEGVATPLRDGAAKIVAVVKGTSASAQVEVRQAGTAPAVTFERDVQPILTAAGCNAGACHGKQGGQNGFQLSLLGFDDNFDFNAVAAEGRGRRVFPSAPARSLLLRKPTSELPHGGGRRLDVGGPHYDVLLKWLSAGMPRRKAGDPVVERIALEPAELRLVPRERHRLIVTAHYSDGASKDVTHLAAFQSSENVFAKVSSDGIVQAGPLPGEAAVMARFMNHIAVGAVLIPTREKTPAAVYEKLPRNNFIDELVWKKLRRLGIEPSGPCGDATFLRRVTIDIIGRPPTPREVREFLADGRPGKRGRLIERLLARPEYADYWANKWADLLRPNPYRVGIKAVFNYDAWIRSAFRRNMPYDQFVRELVTAQGSTFRNGAVTLFRDRRSPDELTTLVSQLFLGVRLECAKCHHHPFEVWGQDDFYSFAAYFGAVSRKGRGLSPPISGSEEIILARGRRPVTHPRTGETMSPHPLFGESPAIAEGEDPRRALARWITSKDNPFFARVIVNRVWADLMGRGLVEPVDDLRATNPPSNGPLLDALAEDFRRHGCDLKKLLKTIASAHVYALSSKPQGNNVTDTRNYSRHYRQRLRAEVLLDAVSDITGVQESFAAMPPGSRAMELWTHRSSSLFLDTFGRPDPNQDPPCERTPDSAVVQTLHLMNSPKLHAKITSDAGRAAKLANSDLPPERIVEEFYVLVYSRFPSEDEARVGKQWFARKGKTRRQAAEDLLWALLNTPEFTFKD